MDPRSEVVIRQKDYLKGQVLLINAPADHMVQDLNSDTVASFWGWNFTEHQAHLNLTENAFFGVEYPNQTFDQAVIFVPKSKELLNYILHVVVSHFKIGQSIFLVGEKKGGVERAAKQLQLFGKTLKLDSARHCQFWQLILEKTETPKPLQTWVKTYDVAVNQEILKICALPGVFSQDHLDIGTKVLLPYLKEVKSGKLADFGCGAGIIGSYLAKLNSSNIIHALDVDAFALASTKMTFQMNSIPEQQLVLQAVSGLNDAAFDFDAIISNPPFHQGIQTNYDASEGLCNNAKLHLKPSGELWIVANRFLNYPVLIDQSFGQCMVKTDQQGFKVIYARAE